MRYLILVVVLLLFYTGFQIQNYITMDEKHLSDDEPLTVIKLQLNNFQIN